MLIRCLFTLALSTLLTHSLQAASQGPKHDQDLQYPLPGQQIWLTFSLESSTTGALVGCTLYSHNFKDFSPAWLQPSSASIQLWEFTDKQGQLSGLSSCWATGLDFGHSSAPNILKVSEYVGPMAQEDGYAYFLIESNDAEYRFLPNQKLEANGNAEIVEQDADSILIRVRIAAGPLSIDMMITKNGNIHSEGGPGLFFLLLASRLWRGKRPFSRRSPPSLATEPNQICREVRELISAGKTGPAVALLLEAIQEKEKRKELVMLSSRFHRNEQARHAGTISKEDYDLELNKVNNGILSGFEDIT